MYVHVHFLSVLFLVNLCVHVAIWSLGYAFMCISSSFPLNSPPCEVRVFSRVYLVVGLSSVVPLVGVGQRR
jgi:hypothetical protein